MARVKATKVGYYDHRRIKVGEEFEMEDKFVKGYTAEKGVVARPCSWVEVIPQKQPEPTKSGK